MAFIRIKTKEIRGRPHGAFSVIEHSDYLYLSYEDQSARQGEPGTTLGDGQVALGAVGCLILGHYAHRRQPGRC